MARRETTAKTDKLDMSETDTATMPCNDCGNEFRRRDLQKRMVIETFDEGLGYEEIPAFLCTRCKGKRFGFDCPQCGLTHNEKEDAEYCCRRRNGEAPDCVKCGRRMEATAKGWDETGEPTVEYAECEGCPVAWGKFTGWHINEEGNDSKD